MAAPAHAFTVDLEDWHHGLPSGDGCCAREDRLLRGVEPLLQMLADRSVRATFFVLGPRTSR